MVTTSQTLAGRGGRMNLEFFFILLVFVAGLFLFWAAVSAIMGSIILHDQDADEREYWEDREREANLNRSRLFDYYVSRGRDIHSVCGLVDFMDLTYPMSEEELIEYADRFERDAKIRGDV
jgi:hypothetical protein